MNCICKSCKIFDYAIFIRSRYYDTCHITFPKLLLNAREIGDTILLLDDSIIHAMEFEIGLHNLNTSFI